MNYKNKLTETQYNIYIKLKEADSYKIRCIFSATKNEKWRINATYQHTEFNFCQNKRPMEVLVELGILKLSHEIVENGFATQFYVLGEEQKS